MATEAKTNLVINGVDRTGGAFASVGARAAAAGAQLRSVLGGALAAAGTYLGFRAIAGGINELGHLSDIAQKANMSVDDLTQTAGAMNILGIQNMGVDQFAKALDYMQKTTGRVGMEGFYQTIEELAKIEDTAKRGQEAMKIFGRSGMEFMPLINAAEGGTEALRGVIDVYPGVSQAAANSGDAMADAMAIASAGAKSLWLEAVGAICNLFDEGLAGGVRTAALSMVNTVTYYARVAVANLQEMFTSLWAGLDKIGAGFSWVGDLVGGVFDGKSIGESFDDANANFLRKIEIADTSAKNLVDEYEKKKAEYEAIRNEQREKIKKFAENYDNAAKGRGNTSNNLGEANGTATAKKAPRVQNKLVMGDSNEARKVAAYGSTLQNETKKQTKILEKIAKNTEKKDGETVDVEALS